MAPAGRWDLWYFVPVGSGAVLGALPDGFFCERVCVTAFSPVTDETLWYCSRPDCVTQRGPQTRNRDGRTAGQQRNRSLTTDTTP